MLSLAVAHVATLFLPVCQSLFQLLRSSLPNLSDSRVAPSGNLTDIYFIYITLYVIGDNHSAHTCSCIFSTSGFFTYINTQTGLSPVYSELTINPLVWFIEAGQIECTAICLLISHVFFKFILHCREALILPIFLGTFYT